MKKNEKRTYLSPETEVVRFNSDIITTSGPTGPNNGGIVTPDGDSPILSDPDIYYTPWFS